MGRVFHTTIKERKGKKRKGEEREEKERGEKGRETPTITPRCKGSYVPKDVYHLNGMMGAMRLGKCPSWCNGILLADGFRWW